MTQRSILHVEDDDAAALLVRMALAESDGSVSCVRVPDVDSALRFLSPGEEPEPDLILLDLNLPPKSGYEVLNAVRGSESLHHIQVVVFTSSAAASDREKSLALGANAYLRKPATFDGYVDALHQVIGMLPEK